MGKKFNSSVEEKRHYKMFKDGKRWVFAAIVAFGIGAVGVSGQGVAAATDTAATTSATTTDVTTKQADSGTETDDSQSKKTPNALALSLVKTQLTTHLAGKATTEQINQLASDIALLVTDDKGQLALPSGTSLTSLAASLGGDNIDKLSAAFLDSTGKVDMTKAESAINALKGSDGLLDANKLNALLKVAASTATATESTATTDTGSKDAAGATDADADSKETTADTDETKTAASDDSTADIKKQNADKKLLLDKANSKQTGAKFDYNNTEFADPSNSDNAYVKARLASDLAVTAPENDTLHAAIDNNNGSASLKVSETKEDEGDGAFTDTFDLGNGQVITATQGEPHSDGHVMQTVSLSSNNSPATIHLGKTATYDQNTGLFTITGAGLNVEQTMTYNPETGIGLFEVDGNQNDDVYVARDFYSGEILTYLGEYAKSSGFNSAVEEFKGKDTEKNAQDDIDKAATSIYIKIRQTFEYAGIDPDSQTATEILAEYEAAKKANDEANPQNTQAAIDTVFGLISKFMTSATSSSVEGADKYFSTSNPPLSADYLQEGNVIGAWNNGYRGEGMVVAVIDNGVEEHTDLKLTDADTAKISEDDANAAIAKLGYGTYVSDKIPFAYNYSDNDDQATNTYSVDHGEHVAGIIGANGESTDEGVDLLGTFASMINNSKLGTGETDGSDTADTQTTDTTTSEALSKLTAALKNNASGDAEKESTTEATETTATSTTTDKTGTKYTIGVAPEAQILDMRVISSGATQEGATIARAIRDAVDLGADVINMSIGGTFENSYDQNIFEQAVKYATDHGVFVAVSAANSGTRAKTGAAGGDEYNPESSQTMTNPATAPTSTAVAAEGDMSVSGTLASMMGMGVKQSVAFFSSWGPSSDFSLRPDVTAPGVSMQSLEYNDQHQSMSGTSMASPFVAGSAALVEQRLKALGFTGEKLATYTKLALMNSAVLIRDDDGLPTSPRQQGAGKVDDEAATKMTVAAFTDNAKSGATTGSVSLYNVGKTTDFTLDFDNYGDTDVTYTFDAGDGVLTSVYATDEDGNLTGTGTSTEKKLDGATIKPEQQTFTVKAGQKLTLHLTLNIADSVAKDQIVEGFLTFKSDATDGTNDIEVPFLGFYGDLTDENVFDEIEDAGVKNYLANEAGLPLGIGSTADAIAALVDNGDTNYANGGSSADDTAAITGVVLDADSSKAAISPNGDGENDEAAPIVYSSENLTSLKGEILSADGTVLRTIDNENNLEASWLNEVHGGESQDFADLALSYSLNADDTALNWDGKLYDQKTGKLVTAPDGQYTYRVTATLEFDGQHKTQTLDLPVTVDTKKPTLTGVAYDASTQTLAANFADQGIGFTTKTLATLTIDGQDFAFNLGSDGKSNTGAFSAKLTDDQVAALQAGNGDIKLTIHDAAGNAGTVTVQTNLGQGKANAAAVDGESIDAPTFQFYLPETESMKESSSAAAEMKRVEALTLKSYGFDVDSYTTPKIDVESDTAVLKAKVSGPAGTKYFVRNLVTGEVFTPTKQVGDDVYFNVDGINKSAELLPNIPVAIFVGYAIAPTGESGVYKESLKDSVGITNTGLTNGINDPDTVFADSTLLSPFTDPAKTEALYTSKEGQSGYTFSLEDDVAYEDSQYTPDILAGLELDAANHTVQKGHTIDVNHTAADLHWAEGSDYDYSRPKQDVLTLDNVELNNYTLINQDSKIDGWDAATGTFTIKGHVDTFSKLEGNYVTEPAVYILGASTDEDDPANKVQVDAKGDFEYQIHLDDTQNRSVALLMIYQNKNADGTFGEVRAYRAAMVFTNDQEDPTLTIDNLDDFKKQADGTYTLTTDKDKIDISGLISDNGDDETVTINGDQVFRQVTGGEAFLMDDGEALGAAEFAKTVALQDGVNYITITAKDQLGNTVTTKLVVTKAAATGKKSATTPIKTPGKKQGKAATKLATKPGKKNQETSAQTGNGKNDKQPAASQDAKPAADAKTIAAAAMPTTGNAENRGLAVLGMIIASMTAMFGLAQRRREHR